MQRGFDRDTTGIVAADRFFDYSLRLPMMMNREVIKPFSFFFLIENFHFVDRCV